MLKCTCKISKLTIPMDSMHTCLTFPTTLRELSLKTNEFCHCEGYDYEQDPEDITNHLLDPFITRRKKLLSRPVGFMLYGKLGIDFFSTS